MSTDRIGWKVYGWLFGALLVFGHGQMWAKGTPGVFDAVDIAVCVPAYVGVLGYAYRKRFLKRGFWRLWAVLVVAWDIAYNVLLTTALGMAQQGLATPNYEGGIATGVAFLLLLPKYLGLFRYAYASSALWEDAGRNPIREAVGTEEAAS